jgi:hypothetical protein
MIIYVLKAIIRMHFFVTYSKHRRHRDNSHITRQLLIKAAQQNSISGHCIITISALKQRRNREIKRLTSEMVEEVVIDEPGRLRAAMAIIDANEGALRSGLSQGERAGLHLTMVFEQLVGLYHRHGKIPGDKLTGVFVPEKPVLTAGHIGTLAPVPGPRSQAPAGLEVIHHRGQHPSSHCRPFHAVS